MNKYLFLLLMFFLVYKIEAQEFLDEKPNILVILVDDMGWSDIGSYGGEIETPNIDRLASNGLRFTQMYNTSKCFPSRAALLTGLYAQQNGSAERHTNPLKNSITLGEVLKSVGYRTLYSGKHHGVDHPMDMGFDRYYGLLDGAGNHFNPGLQRKGEPMPAQKRNDRIYYDDRLRMQPYTPPTDFYTTDYFTKYALSWLEEYKEEEAPFFLYLSYTAPHDPLMAWPEDIAKYRGKYSEGYEAIRNKRLEKQRKMGLFSEKAFFSKPTYRNWDSLSDSLQNVEELKMEVYAAMVDRVDQNIGKILQKIEEQGRLDNTLIFFMSDNGSSAEMVRIAGNGEIGTVGQWTSLGEDWANVSNTPFRYFKNYSYEGGINTPMIVTWPNKIGKNGFTEFPGHFIDFMPTLIEITGAEYPEEWNGEALVPMQGESFLPTLLGEEQEREKPLFWQWQEGKAIRKGNMKLVTLGEDSPWELYDLEKDPAETTNLSDRYPELVDEFKIMYADWEAYNQSIQ